MPCSSITSTAMVSWAAALLLIKVGVMGPRDRLPGSKGRDTASFVPIGEIWRLRFFDKKTTMLMIIRVASKNDVERGYFDS